MSIIRKRPFFAMPKDLIDDGTMALMGANTWVVYCVCARHSDHEQTAGIDLIQERTGLTKQEVVEAIARLAELDLLDPENQSEES